MSKTIEIPDIAMWEETDSELTKYTIQKQNYEMEEAVEQDNRKKSMMDVSMNQDFFNKSYEEMRKVVCAGSKASLQAIIDGNKEFKFTVDGTEYTAKVKNKFNNSFEIIGVNDKHNRGEDNEA